MTSSLPVSEEGFLQPVRTEEAAGFWEGTAAGELRVQECARCGRLRFPPRPMCPTCQSVDRGWRVMSGLGTIWSYSIPHPPLLPAYAAVAPYNVILVELDEDPKIRMVGNLVTSPAGGIDEIDPHSIVIGERVRAVFHSLGDVTLVRWARVAE